MDTKNNIRINLTGLSPKETAVFQRVISFNMTHGLKAETVSEASNADLIITTADFFDLINIEKENKTFIVVSDDETNPLGDLQIKPPLIITKIMGLITEAVKLTETKLANALEISSDKDSNEKNNIDDTEVETQNIISEASSEDQSDTEVETQDIISDASSEDQSETEVETQDIISDTSSEDQSDTEVETQDIISDASSEELSDTEVETQDIISDASSEEQSDTEDQIETPEDNIEEKKPHHALIIDDSAAIRKQLELELRDAGITSDFAECGEDAIEKTKETHFDLIFLDIIMPGIDGYETCKSIRSDTLYKKTPIIMLSGKTSPLDEVQGVIAGATTYLTKPVKSDKLQETLNRVTKWIENFAPSKTSY